MTNWILRSIRCLADLARLGVVLMWGITISASALSAQSISDTKHNLSAGGPGPVKAVSETQICIFCHAPHRASGQAPLWNREDSRANYIVYTSPTLDAALGQPTGSSRLCLSCHDGTIALGNVSSESGEIQFEGGTIFLPSGHSLITTDLGDDHPISFIYDDALALSDQELRIPSALPPTIPLDHESRMQCASCHDAHNDDFGSFLRESPLFSPLCLGCHDKNGWVGASHATAGNTWNGSGIDPWPHADGATVAENGCMNCHQAHEAGQPPQLLSYAQEENNCLVCHSGNVGSDVNAALSLVSTHPVSSFTGIHQPGESPQSMPRHVECTDCHNPHAANSADPPPPGLSGSLQLTSGVDIDANPVFPASYSYEICLKCHGDSHGSLSVVTRQVNNLNTRQDFHPMAVSFHPVAAVGKNSDVPSLIPPLNENSIIKCEDCHSAPAGFVTGTHGSDFVPLLKLNYETTDFTQESPQAYALCYSCHDRSTILSSASFKEHEKHLGEDVPCAVCHDAHGVMASGDVGGHGHLINFDVTVVFPDPETGRLEFVEGEPGKGECYLLCHNESHSPKSY